MSNTLSEHLSKTLGGAAAAMLSVGAIAPAQVSAGAVRRDSVATTRVIFLQGRMDSVAVLAHRIAQERYGSPAWVELTGQLDSLVASVLGNKLRLARGNLIAPAMPLRTMQAAKGYLGINTQGPTLIITDSSGTQRYRFLAYQPIISVDLGSPADRAGIEPGDVLVGYNGVDLINHEFNLSDLLVPKKRVDVSVRRGGEVKEYALTAASTPEEVVRRRMDLDKVFRFEIPAAGTMVVGGDEPVRFGGGGEPPLGGSVRAGTALPRNPAGRVGAGRGTLLATQKLFFLSPNGLFGANLSNVSDDLAKVLKLRKGILVNEVPEETPAFRAGLRSGDVIVAADDDTVTTVGQLRDLMLVRYADHSAELQVIRERKTKKLTVSWPE